MGEERRDWITTVEHDPADRQADGRWPGILVQKKVPVREIRWKGLYDRSSNKCKKKAITQSDFREKPRFRVDFFFRE